MIYLSIFSSDSIKDKRAYMADNQFTKCLEKNLVTKRVFHVILVCNSNNLNLSPKYGARSDTNWAFQIQNFIEFQI